MRHPLLTAAAATVAAVALPTAAALAGDGGGVVPIAGPAALAVLAFGVGALALVRRARRRG